LTKLYRAVQEVAAAQVIVDSSKDATYAWFLRQTGAIDLRLVHLIRDSRGVAHSWAKRQVERPEYAKHPTLAGTFMQSRGPSRAAVEWAVKNTLLQLLRRSGTPGVRVKYESLATESGSVLEAAIAAADSPVSSEAVGADLMQHSLGGNRVRFTRGPVKLSLDEEWRTQMPRSTRRLVTAWTLPLLVAYGYPLTRQPIDSRRSC
jgi:hypothetical protein